LSLSFSVVPGDFAVARLPPAAPVPDWAQPGRFWSATRTAEELSIVCAESSVPPEVRAERGWALLQLRGPFPFEQVGVLDSFLRPLAAAGVSVFAIATFDTDYVLVKSGRLPDALSALAAAGHEYRA
jgi:hypothetical protein